MKKGPRRYYFTPIRVLQGQARLLDPPEYTRYKEERAKLEALGKIQPRKDEDPDLETP